MKKLGFTTLLVNWFCISLVLHIINGYTLQSPFLYSLVRASLGIFLLIHPVWPGNLSSYWPEKKCRLFIRILAVAEIIFSFMTRMNF